MEKEKTKTPPTQEAPKQEAPKSNQNTPKKNPAEEAADWNKRYETAKTYQLPMFQKWSKWYDDMYAHLNSANAAPWRSKVYMPIIASKVWDLISRFIQYRPGWEVGIRTLPVNTLSQEAFDEYMAVMNQRIEKVKMKLYYDYDNPLMDEPIQDELLGVMLDAAVTGQGLGRVPYLNKTSEYKEYADREGGGVDFGNVKQDTATEGYNSFQAVNIFNLFIMPGAKGLQKSPWLIVKDRVPLYEITRDTKYDQNAVKNLKTEGLTNEFAQYEASRNRLVNTEDTSSLDGTTQMVEIYECWDKETNECIIYGLGSSDDGNWVELYRTANVYWHQKYPFVPFYIRRKPYQFWGESLFENSETLQAAINDIFNHFMDGHNMADGMIAIEEGSVVEPYIIEPGGELRYRGELPKQFKFPQPDAAGAQMAINLINGAIENATISQYASGVPNSAVDQTQGTATGVTRMMEAAAEKVGFMRANFRRSWREVGQMWTYNSQQFMNTDVVFEQKQEGKVNYEVIRPEDIKGIFSINVDDGSFEPISKDEKRQNFLEYVTNMAAWQEASVAQAERTGDYRDALRLNWSYITTRGAEHYGENVSQILLPSTPPPQQPQMPPIPGMPSDPANIPTGAPQEVPLEPPMEEAPPMSPEEAGLAFQADGKSMPDSFPVRSVMNPAFA